MSIGKAITCLIEFYYQAKNNDCIQKPIAWALYQTWKWADEREKGSRKDGDNT